MPAWSPADPNGPVRRTELERLVARSVYTTGLVGYASRSLRKGVQECRMEFKEFKEGEPATE
jgi:hypothetical protein